MLSRGPDARSTSGPVGTRARLGPALAIQVSSYLPLAYVLATGRGWWLGLLVLPVHAIPATTMACLFAAFEGPPGSGSTASLLSVFAGYVIGTAINTHVIAEAIAVLQDGYRRGRRTPRSSRRIRGPTTGFTVIELAVVLLIAGILAAIAIPQLLGAREKARVATCDNIYVALNSGFWGERNIADPIDTGNCGTTVDDVVECVVSNHQNEDNPRNRATPAYVRGEPGVDPLPCQVAVVPLGERTIQFRQRPKAGVPVRTFSVLID